MAWDVKLFDWSDEITADCPRKQAMNLSNMCGARCRLVKKAAGPDVGRPRTRLPLPGQASAVETAWRPYSLTKPSA